MIDNPQLLVDQFNDSHTYRDQHTAMQSLDAIFIPFRNRFDNVNALLGELEWYQGPIYVMPSSHSEMDIYRLNRNIYELSFIGFIFP